MQIGDNVGRFLEHGVGQEGQVDQSKGNKYLNPSVVPTVYTLLVLHRL
jgi:hypothetical protein